MLIRSVLLVGSVTLVALPRQAQAQAATSPAAVPNPFAITNVKRFPISKSVFGDAGIIVNARDDGFIEVAAAGPKTVLVQLRAIAARGWLDSTTRMLRATPKRSKDAVTFRSGISDYVGKASMALTRTVTAGKSEFALTFADDPASAFTVPIEASEADVFVAVVRKAVVQSVKLLDKPDTTAAAVDSAPPAPKKKPAAKRTSPPAQTPAKPSTTTKPATTTPARPATSTPAKPAASTATPVKPA